MTVFDRLKAIFAQQNDIEDTSHITLQSSLNEDLGINSIGRLYMALAIESEFGIEFSNGALVSFVTVGDVVNYIESAML